MKQGQANITTVARLLESAARKHNESADATCSVAACFDVSDGLTDQMFDDVYDAVAELARVSLDKKPDFKRAARQLIAKAAKALREGLSR
jgi:hypothetical protein